MQRMVSCLTVGMSYAMKKKRWTKSKTNKKLLGKTSGNACTSSTFYLTTHFLQIQNALVLTLSQKDYFISGGEENHDLMTYCVHT